MVLIPKYEAVIALETFKNPIKENLRFEMKRTRAVLDV